MGKYMK